MRALPSMPMTIGGVVLVWALAGCASIDPQQSLDHANAATAAFTEGRLELARDPDQMARRRLEAQALLAGPLGQREAVQLALVNSPGLQALLAQGWADAAGAAQAGRIANPVFHFERLRAGDELELGRSLSLGLLDLLSLPQRKRLADRRTEQLRWKLAAEVIDQITQVRQAWVRAVAAQMGHRYAQQVNQSAAASAELARRMEAVGHFNRLSRARQQVFYADAAAQLASSRHQMVAAREALVRHLGLDEEQAQQLTLPERLPELPTVPLAPESVVAAANQGRLDLRQATADWNVAARAQGLDRIIGWTDVELALKHNTTSDSASGTRVVQRGVEFSVQLPLFDTGRLRREVMDAQTLAASLRLEAVVRSAGSQLRESYSAYRSAHDIARHYRQEVVPLRKAISDENLLRYNGMLISVFELLADAREQVGTVLSAISAEQQFWLAEAALQAAVVGRPVTADIAWQNAVRPMTDAPAH